MNDSRNLTKTQAKKIMSSKVDARLVGRTIERDDAVAMCLLWEDLAKARGQWQQARIFGNAVAEMKAEKAEETAVARLRERGIDASIPKPGLTEEHLGALRRYAAFHGRKWRAALRTYWSSNGLNPPKIADIHLMQQVRFILGARGEGLTKRKLELEK